MTIQVACNQCNKTFQVDEKFIWKKWQCPKCKNIFKIIKTEEKEPQVIIHEQKIEEIPKENIWLFSSENLAKAGVTVFILAMIGWNAFVYYDSRDKRATEKFIAIYNSSIVTIKDNVSTIADNISNEAEISRLEIEVSNLESWLKHEDDIDEIKRINDEIEGIRLWMKDLESKTTENYPLFQYTYPQIDKIQEKACPLLPTSSNACLDYIKSYRMYIQSIEQWDIENMHAHSEDLYTKTTEFHTAIENDGVEF